MRPAEDIRAEAALRAADAEQWRATLDAEAKAYALSSMPCMIECDADGRVRGLDEVVASFRGPAGEIETRNVDRVSISENVGIIMGREGTRHFMHVYLHKSGRWRLMARHLAS